MPELIWYDRNAHALMVQYRPTCGGLQPITYTVPMADNWVVERLIQTIGLPMLLGALAKPGDWTLTKNYHHMGEGS